VQDNGPHQIAVGGEVLELKVDALRAPAQREGFHLRLQPLGVHVHAGVVGGAQRKLKVPAAGNWLWLITLHQVVCKGG